MIRSKNLTILIATFLIATATWASGAKKIVVDDETLKVLDEHYQVYNQRNVRKVAQREVARTIFYKADENLFQNAQSVVMPICDEQRHPFQWNYIAPSDSERVLKFIGEKAFNAQFLKWTDSVWIRIAGPFEKFREGMYCGEPLADGPSSENFAIVEIDQSFSENIKERNTPTELIDAALLQLASKYVGLESRKVKAEITLSVSLALNNLSLGIEIWSVGENSAKQESSSWQTVAAGSSPQTIAVEAQIPQGRQAHLILRLDPRQRDSAAIGNLSGKIFIMDARIYPL